MKEDITLKENISYETHFNNISKLNEETLMPYHFDILNFSNTDLNELIDRIGIIFNKKKK